jgi:hypothetical protein
MPDRELVDQRGLADTCLTADQDQSPSTGPSLREPSAEGVERWFPLDQLHAPLIVPEHP